MNRYLTLSLDNKSVKHAPIVLFVYNRPWHTRQTIESLQRNTLAPVSDLIVYADGPKKLEHVAAVDEVREYIRRIKGFNSVTFVERSENYGLARSIILGVTEVVSRFDRIIVLEDDLVTSPHFLTFMNEALDYYQDDDRVVSIHGYMFPVSGFLPETFFLKDTGSWGWATWKRGWDLFEADGSLLLKELQNSKLTRAFDMDGAYPFSEILKEQVAGKNDSWAIRWQASAFLRNGLTLFPGNSLINNIGHDSSGVHCGTTALFENELTQEPVLIGTAPVEENLEVMELLKSFFRTVTPGLYVRICMKLRRILICWYSKIHQRWDLNHKTDALEDADKKGIIEPMR